MPRCAADPPPSPGHPGLFSQDVLEALGGGPERVQECAFKTRGPGPAPQHPVAPGSALVCSPTLAPVLLRPAEARRPLGGEVSAADGPSLSWPPAPEVLAGPKHHRTSQTNNSPLISLYHEAL